jgi:hypothetical protein
MKLISRIAVYLLYLILIYAGPQMVFAQEQAEQPKSPTITWKENDPNCDLIAVEGARYRIIKHNGLFIAFEFIEADGFYVGAIMVANNSDRRFLVDPTASFLALWKDVKKTSYDVIQPTPPDKIARKIESRAGWQNAFRSAGAVFATTTQTTNTSQNGSVVATGTGGSATGTYAGSSSSTTTAPDMEARRRAEEQNAETTAQAQSKAAGVMSAGLKANTLFTNDRVFGEIYFQKKKFKAGFFVFKIEDTFYQYVIAPAQK